MIKIFIGAEELALDYNFIYNDDKTAYSKTDRVINGTLSLGDSSEMEKLNFIKEWSKGIDITIVEPKQEGYLVNVASVSDILFSDKINNGSGLFELELVKRTKPFIAKEVKQVEVVNNSLANLEARHLIGITVSEINQEGEIFFVDNKFLKVTDTTDKYHVGNCSLKTGGYCYITQPGGSNIKFVQGHGGISFKNWKIKIGPEEDQTSKITGKVLVIN